MCVCVCSQYLSNMMDEMQRVYGKSTKHALLNPQKGTTACLVSTCLLTDNHSY